MWITLHSIKDSNILFVNSDHICVVCKLPAPNSEDNSTYVQFVGNSNNVLEVKESPEEVIRKITG